MTQPLLEIMTEMLGRAVSDGRKPLRWEVNLAAKFRIEFERRAVDVEPERPAASEFMRPILGIPVLQLADHTYDPRFRLIVDEASKPEVALVLPQPDMAEAHATLVDARRWIDDHFYGQPPPSDGADKLVIIGEIFAELRRRHVNEPGISPSERRLRERMWNPNPPCPDCGSFDHFEC